MSFDRKTTSSLSTSNDATAMEDKESARIGRGPSTPLTRLEIFSLHIPGAYVVPLSGALAGAASGIVSCPLDVIKTKLQAQGGFKLSKDRSLSNVAYKGISGTASMIWREDGLRGMYRGLGPMLLGYVPTWVVYLTVYNQAQAYFRTKTESLFLANVYASIAGGASSTMVTNPIWVIKTRLMSQSGSQSASSHSRSPWHYHNTLDAARKMYRNEGLLSFYSGLTPALLGLTHVAIQFPLYEVFKAKFTGMGAGVKESDEDKVSHFYGISLAVFLSKVCASTATYPHEVVRTRLQTQQRSGPGSPAGSTFKRGLEKARDHGRPPGGPTSSGIANSLRYKGTIQTCQTIWFEEGWRGFYAGLGTNLIRAVPSAMTTIITFEYLKKAMFKHQREGKAKSEYSGPRVL